MSRTGGRGQEGRRWIGIDLDPRNEALVRERVVKVGGKVEADADEVEHATASTVEPLDSGPGDGDGEAPARSLAIPAADAAAVRGDPERDTGAGGDARPGGDAPYDLDLTPDDLDLDMTPDDLGTP